MRVIGLAGWSGSGKTTLLTRLIPVLVARGLSVSTIKHAHHAFDVDRPGKDSFQHRQAGAREVLVASRRRWALMRELRDEREPRLAELVALIDDCDILLVEGFKREEHVKVEVYRKANGKPPLHPDDGRIVAVASDVALPDAGRPVIDIDDIETIADVVIAHAEPVERLMERLSAHGPAE